MPTIRLRNFTKGLFLIGGRDLDPSALRKATNTNPIRTTTIRSRWGTKALLPNIVPVRCARFGTNRIAADKGGVLRWLPDAFAGTTATWTANTAYALNTLIVDSNNNVQEVTTAGTSGSTAPTWSTTINATTADGTVTWTMVAGQIRTGLSGTPVFVKAPPAAGDVSYLFVCGPGAMVKIDPNGNITNWGIQPPTAAPTLAAAAPTYQPIVIDTMVGTSNTTITPNATQSTDTTTATYGNTSSLLVTINKTTTASLTSNAFSPTLNLSGTDAVSDPDGQQSNDFFSVWLQVDHPEQLTYFEIDFDLSTNYKSDYYTAYVPLPSTLGFTHEQPRTKDVASLADAFGLHFINSGVGFSATLPPGGLETLQTDIAAAYSQLSSLSQTQLAKTLSSTAPAASKPRIKLSPRSKKSVGAANNVRHIVQASGWFEVRIPKSSFERIGKNTSVNWSTVSGYRFRIGNKHSSNPLLVHFNQLQFFYKNVGMFGDYTYAYTFRNSTTGVESQPSPFATITNINSTGVVLSGLQTSPDPQVDSRVIYRTVGNGGILFEAGVLTDNTSTTYTDTASDFVGGGFNDSQNSLSLHQLLEVWVVPPATVTQAIFFNGTMFLCGDTTPGAKGRLYYSAPGYAEGIAGYTDVSNDDDPTVGFGIYLGNLYLFTQKAVWRINDLSSSPILPLYGVTKITAVDGTPFGLSIAPSSQGVVYQTPNALLMFNGLFSRTTAELAPQIKPIFAGESVEGYGPIGPAVAADFCRQEFVVSDGSTAAAISMADQSARIIQPAPTALFYESDTGEIQCGFPAGGWGLLEHFGATTDFSAPIPFDLMTFAAPPNEGYPFKVQRVFVDCNTNNDTLSVALIVDGTSYALGTLSTAARSVVEFEANIVGRVVGVELTGNLSNGITEIFEVDLVVDTAT